MHGSSANVTELPMPPAWEARIAQAWKEGREEGIAETQEKHAQHVREFEKDRYQHHRIRTIAGMILLVAAAICVGLTEGQLFHQHRQFFDTLFWCAVVWLASFTYYHENKRAHYLKHLNRKR